MNSFVLILSFCLSIVTNPTETVPVWGKTGHRAVGEIATKHLKIGTKKKLKTLLNHESLALASTFADDIKSDKRYDKFKPWHYINMPLDGTYETATKNPEGDLVTGIAFCKQVITDESSSNADRVLYLKLLIHLIGDLHQPFHIGLKADRGGNDFKVKWKSRNSNMHRVWDSQMLDDYGMSFTELSQNTKHLKKTEISALQEGTILDWVKDTHQLTKQVYASAKNGENLRNKYSYTYLNVARQQIQKAGIRLAQVLNTIL